MELTKCTTKRNEILHFEGFLNELLQNSFQSVFQLALQDSVQLRQWFHSKLKGMFFLHEIFHRKFCKGCVTK